MSSRGALIHCATGVMRGLAIIAFLSVPVLAQGQPESLSAGFRKAAGRVGPALVGVRALGVSRPIVNVPIPSIGQFRPGDFIPRGVLRGGEVEGESIGTGFVVDADRGIVVTTEGVLRGTSQAMVIFAEGAERVASQIRRDPRSELAILVVDVKGVNATAASWGDSNALEPGDWVLALGSAGGSPPSMSAGIYSARRHGVGDDWLETDTRIGPGNLGGPVVNLKGEVVGICTGFPGRAGGELAGLNHVLPASRVRRIARELADFGQVRRGYLGVQIEPVEMLSGRPGGSTGAVVISSVGSGTPAADAGLQPGDRIVSANGRRLAGLGQLQTSVEDTPIGEELTLLVDRNGQRIEVKVRPQAQPVAADSGGMPRARIESEIRRDSGRDRARSRVVPAKPAPVQSKPPEESAPSSLDPIPGVEEAPARPSPVPPVPRPE
jgi:serine protease Do